MKYANILFLALASLTISSCSQDSPLPDSEGSNAGEYIYTLSLDAPDASRAVYPFADGDMLYLTFFSAGRSVPAWAKYEGENGYWEVHSSESLGKNEYGNVNIAYFMYAPGEETFTEFAISPANNFFMTRRADYAIIESKIKITATLMPQGVRMRFKKSGTDDTTVEVTGLNTYKNWYPSTGEFDSKLFTKDVLRPDAEGLVTSYKSVFLVNANPGNPSLNFFRVLVDNKVMTYPFDEYQAMFEAGSVATIDLSDPKHSAAYSTVSTSTPQDFSNLSSTPAIVSLTSRRWGATGGLHVKGKLTVNEYSGASSEAGFSLVFAGSTDTEYYRKDLFAGGAPAVGSTIEVDVNFCLPELVGHNLYLYPRVEYYGGSFTLSDKTITNF